VKERTRVIGAVILLIMFSASVAKISLGRALPELGWPDEWIYLTQARNIAERGTLNTNFYIASSIEKLGYPHRDVHLPGYALALAAVGSWNGYTFKTATALNIACYLVTVLSVFFLAKAFFSTGRSFMAATLVAIVPPYPGYLAVAYPEHVTASALIVLVTIAAWIRGAFATFLLGFAVGASLLFRETVLFALPIFFERLGLLRSVRFFLPGLLLAGATLLPPFSAKRAIHPNALYPSAITEALASPEPLSRLFATIGGNARINLELFFSSNPIERAEDAVLLFLIALAMAALLGSLRGVAPGDRPFALAVVLSTALLFAAMVVVYVVRERGGVWGGVRALMPMAPLFVVILCGLRMGRIPTGILATILVAASLFLNSWQIAFFNRYKGSNLEDQDRAATFIETRTKRFAPRRVVGGRYFQYAFRNFPAEVVWSGADTMANLNRLYLKAPFDFVVIHRRSTMRFDLRKDQHYEWLNADEGQAAEYQIYRRVAP